MDTDEDFFALLAADLQEEPDLRLTVQRAVGYARALVRSDEASVRVHRRAALGMPPVVAATSTRAEGLAQLSLVHAAPGTPARETGPLAVDDVLLDARWPEWCAAVSARGYRSALAVPLLARDRDLGVLTLWSERPGAFRRHDDDAALAVLVRHVAVAVADLLASHDLEQARATRALVGQAQGILMERHGLDADTAFSVLRRHSQQGNLKLADVAHQLVATRSLPEAPRRRSARSAVDPARGSADGTPASA